MLVHWEAGQVAQRKSVMIASERNGLQISDGLSGGHSPLTPLWSGSGPREAGPSNPARDLVFGACSGQSVQHT